MVSTESTDYSSESGEEITSKLREEPFDETTSSNYEVPNFKGVKNFRRKSASVKQNAMMVDREKNIRGREFIKAVRTMVKNGMEEYKRAEMADEGEMVGVVVNRISDMGYHVGEVVDYDERTRLFKIEYEDEKVEEVNMPELRELIAPAKMVSKYTDCVEARKHEKKKKKWVATTSLLSISSSSNSSN